MKFASKWCGSPVLDDTPDTVDVDIMLFFVILAGGRHGRNFKCGVGLVNPPVFLNPPEIGQNPTLYAFQPFGRK